MIHAILIASLVFVVAAGALSIFDWLKRRAKAAVGDARADAVAIDAAVKQDAETVVSDVRSAL